ncbi:F-box only protein 31 isoform X2 [Aplysia californica]|uniref:F-box only protein 31 isoform X2 n=1 Tax=Aplysia californica TaxID=6500 RepID=A0ABM1VP72_APLCA|nr:F-box only protein 31 isoform X2 [Aplysia californica]
MNLTELPAEMLQHISAFLDSRSLATFGSVCRKCREVSEIETLWQGLCKKDFQVTSVKGWDLSYKHAYTKVLVNCNFLGLKRLALLPYGGLVNVSWGVGEIQVNGHTAIGRSDPEHPLICEPYFCIRWSHDLDRLQVFCAQSENSACEEAILIEDPQYPLMYCRGRRESHVRNKRGGKPLKPKYGQSDPRLRRGFNDHPGAFEDHDLSCGFNCPLLSLPALTSEYQQRSRISLGLYTGDYGSHGTEILYFMMSSSEPYHLEGLKIVGDPNVPAGYVSLHVSLDKPIILSGADQTTVYQLIEMDETRNEESYHELLCSNDNNPDLRQPFMVPHDCFERSNVAQNSCLARFRVYTVVWDTTFQKIDRDVGHDVVDSSACKFLGM